MQVGRSISEIDAKVKELSTSISESTARTKDMDRALKLNPKSVETAARRTQVLRDAVGQATQRVALLKQKQIEANRAFAAGEIGAEEFRKIKLEVERAEIALVRFNGQLRTAKNMEVQQLARQFDRVTNALNKTQRVARGFSRLMMGLVGIIGASITAFVREATALAEVARQYDMSITKLQAQQGLYKQITGDANGYTNALESLRKTLNKITLGQGQGYANILKHLGISTVDATGKAKTQAQIYDELLESLRAVEDITLRNRLAYELFGDEAINVIELLNLSTEEYQALMEAQAEQARISEENAQAALEVQEAWDSVKQEFMRVGAELAVALLPLIKALTDILVNVLLPILVRIANWFASMTPQEQKFVAFLVILIIFLPKIIAIVKIIILVVKGVAIATKLAAVGTGALSATAMPLIPILLAVAAVVLILALLFAFMTGQSKNLTKQLDSQKGAMDGIADGYGDMGGGMDFNATQTSQNNNSTTTDINVNIDSRGDNPIAEENAELVADLLADRINKELGGKI